MYPSPDRLPHVVAQVGEGHRGHPGPEVGAPAPQYWVEPAYQDIEGLVHFDLTAYRLHFGHDRLEGLLGRVGIDVLLVRAFLPVTLDTPAEKVKAVIDV